MESKTALLMDTVMEFGGAEKVQEVFMEMFPNSNVYTLMIVPAARKRIEKRFPKIKIHTSIFQLLAGQNKLSKYISVIKLFSWIYWELLDLSEYNLVVSSSHSFMSKNVKTKKSTFHISYIHTPPRYLYEEFSEIGWIKKFPIKIILYPVMVFLRWIDKSGAKRPDVLVANSENVKNRIEKYYSCNARVLYPPVESLNVRAKKEDYFVCVSRLVKQKGIELAVKTCTKFNLPLTVIGDGGEMGNLKKIAGKSVKFLGKVGDKEKWGYMAKAKALIYTSINEDFGLVPVEALTAGTPVIGYNSGGVKESVIEGKNGILFDEFTISSLKLAIDKFESMKIKSENCRKTAEKFSVDKFKKNINKIIANGQDV